MAAVAVIDAYKDHTVIVSEVRPSFSDYSSACQYIAQCACGWSQQHIVLHALIGDASRHAAVQARDTHNAEQH
jgi:hypothetical protein